MERSHIVATRDMLQKVLDERAKVWEQAKALNDTVLSENRNYEGEEESAYQRMTDDLNKFDDRIRDLQSKLEQERRADEARAALGHDPRPAVEEERQEKRGIDRDADMLRKIGTGELRGASFAAEARDLTKGSATAGGNTVPTSFRAALLEHMIETSAIRQTRASVLTTSSGEDMQFPKTTSHSSASLITEGSAITESDPAFGQVTIGAFKYAILIQTSRELLEDTAVDLVGYLARQAGRALGNASGAHMATGDGSGKPNGIVTASTAGVTGGTGQSGVPTTNELIDLFYSVIAPYRRDGEWEMSDATLAAIRKLKDSNGQYVWSPGLTAGDPDTLLGKPVVVNPDVADAALSAKSVVFGDHSTYQIRDVNGIDVARSDDFAFSSDLVTWRFVFRTDADLLDTTGAVKHYVGGAS